MLAEQDGGGLTQLKFVLAGAEVRVMFVATPVQMVLGEIALTTGTGLTVMASGEVCPGAKQFEFVP